MSGGPLQGKRIAVTRALEQSEELAAQLTVLDAQVVECPAISIAPLEDYAAMDAAIRRLPEFDWVVFTSVNGVHALVDRMIHLEQAIGLLAERKLAAIGPATATALQEAGCAPAFVPSTYVAEAIVEEIGDVKGCHVLLPRADIARQALAEGLRRKGALVEELAAYRTVPGQGIARLAGLLSEEEIEAITFTSSSTVRYTIEGLESAGVDRDRIGSMLARVAVVCIGPITAATAAEYGLHVAKVASEYTSDGLVAALVELFGHRRKEETKW